jgi:hypothetical protein
MGASASAPSGGAPAAHTPSPAARAADAAAALRALQRTGRYAALTSPGSGATVHVLGVFPCSARSAAEAAGLVAAARPRVVYVGLHPELAAVLEGDVRAGRLAELGWRIPEQAPPFSRFDDAGWLVSLYIRNLLADNEMLGLLGAEALLPFKAAIRAALRLAGPAGVGGAGAAAGGGAGGLGGGGGGGGGGGAGGGSAARWPAGPLLAFPLAMAHNNGETVEQPSQLTHILVGNASASSTRVTALVGNPSVWHFDAAASVRHAQLVAEHDAARAAERARVEALGAEALRAELAARGAPAPAHELPREALVAARLALPDAAAGGAAGGALPPHPGPAPPVVAPDVSFDVDLPAEGYFTRDAVLALQAEFRGLVDRACARATAASADVEADLLARERAASALGTAEGAQLAATFSERSFASQRQSQAAAFAVQSAVDAAVAAAAEAGDAGFGGAAAGAGAGGAGGAGAALPCAVAIVNLGSMASLQRNWAEARPGLELFPPPTAAQTAAGYGVPAVAASAVLYGTYRGLRRFPRAVGLLVAGAGLGAGALGYSAVYSDWARYGAGVRSALARPKITSPLARVNR